MEAEASGAARGAPGSLLASAQEGGAVELRAEELCSAELGPGLDRVRRVLAAEATVAAGDGSVAAAGAEVRPDAGGGDEDVAGESQLGEDEEPEVRQSADLAEQWGEEQGPEGGLVAVQPFVAEGVDLTHVEQVWAADASLGPGGKVWLDLHVGRQEEVLAQEPSVEGEEGEVPRGPDGAGEWDQGQSIRGQLAAGEEFVLEGAGCPLEGQVVEEAEEESQAEAKGQGQGSGKQPRAGPGPRGPCSWSPLEALEALQLEMEPVNEQARRAFSRLQRRTWQRRQPHLELRSTLIQRLRGFWPEAFVNHPELSAMISDQDKSMLSFMIDLKVEKSKDHCKILLLFRRNPYFRNDVVVKEYVITLTGSRASYSTPIQWHKHYEREAYSRRHNNSSLNFFNWFSDHSLAGSGRIAEYICNDLWPNPLKYYGKKTEAGEETEKRTGEKALPGNAADGCQEGQAITLVVASGSTEHTWDIPLVKRQRREDWGHRGHSVAQEDFGDVPVPLAQSCHPPSLLDICR
ncbi:testis-specific Y-encoded protein 2-like [Desmodus rotundus]|uniref:testis-specific Y-encoded protein 2-like n=1 Tax=Desmodus rotundus TaxID=9430 RepID=UPI0039E66D1D